MGIEGIDNPANTTGDEPHLQPAGQPSTQPIDAASRYPQQRLPNACGNTPTSRFHGKPRNPKIKSRGGCPTGTQFPSSVYCAMSMDLNPCRSPMSSLPKSILKVQEANNATPTRQGSDYDYPDIKHSSPFVFKSPSAGRPIFDLGTPSSTELCPKSSKVKMDVPADPKQLTLMKDLFCRTIKMLHDATKQWQINKVKAGKVLKDFLDNRLQNLNSVNKGNIDPDISELMEDFGSAINNFVLLVTQMRARCMKVFIADMDRETRDTYRPFNSLTVTEITSLMCRLYRSYGAEFAAKKDLYQHTILMCGFHNTEDMAADTFNNIVDSFMTDVHIKEKNAILATLAAEIGGVDKA